MGTIKLTEIIDVNFSAKSEEDVKNYLPESNTIDQRHTKTHYSKAIQEKARVSAIQISHWTNTGVIIPATAVKGTGKMHVYDHQNLIEAMICRELSQFSINYGVMREVLDFLRKKQWLFDIGLSFKRKPDSEAIIDGQFTATTSTTFQSIEKRLRIWDFFKLHPQPGIIYLLLWKDSTSIELPKPKKGEFNMHLATKNALDIISRCPTVIAINLTLLLSEAGSFYEEAAS